MGNLPPGGDRSNNYARPTDLPGPYLARGTLAAACSCRWCVGRCRRIRCCRCCRRLRRRNGAPGDKQVITPREVELSLTKVQQWVERHDYKGYEPFDGLCSWM